MTKLLEIFHDAQDSVFEGRGVAAVPPALRQQPGRLGEVLGGAASQHNGLIIVRREQQLPRREGRSRLVQSFNAGLSDLSHSMHMI